MSLLIAAQRQAAAARPDTAVAEIASAAVAIDAQRRMTETQLADVREELADARFGSLAERLGKLEPSEVAEELESLPRRSG
jgi:hypothetical protein